MTNKSLLFLAIFFRWLESVPWTVLISTVYAMMNVPNMMVAKKCLDFSDSLKSKLSVNP